MYIYFGKSVYRYVTLDAPAKIALLVAAAAAASSSSSVEDRRRRSVRYTRRSSHPSCSSVGAAVSVGWLAFYFGRARRQRQVDSHSMIGRKLELGLFFLVSVFAAQFFFVSVNMHWMDLEPTSDLSTPVTAVEESALDDTSSGDDSVKISQKGDSKKKGGAKKGQQMMMGKRRKRKKPSRNWDPGLDGLGGPAVPLHINLPVFVPSLPKSGTTSIWQYFNCGGHMASHQWVKVNSTHQMQTGECVAKNLALDRAPFDGCGKYDVYTDTGFANYRKPQGSTCFYPSIDALDEIYKHYPNITFVMVVRNTTQWYDSMMKWGEGSLLSRWRPCNATGLPGFKSGPQDFLDFYDWHNENIRQFVKDKPSIKYIEVQLESNETGDILEREIGIPKKCWAKCTPYSKFCKATT